ncbi:hypothetical protein [Chryseobacterium wanjuense]
MPKGEVLPDENLLESALTEFKEETGKTIEGKFIELSPVQQKSGKKSMPGLWKVMSKCQIFKAIPS